MKKLILLILLIAIATTATAQDSRLIPFKARVTLPGSNPVADGTYDLTFKVYSVEVGAYDSAIWSETHTKVEIIKGQVDILLGQVTPLNFDFKSERFIGISIGMGPEMFPRHQLIPVFHAVSSEFAYQVDTSETADHAELVTTADTAEHALNVDFADIAIWVTDVTSSAISEDALMLNNDTSSDYAKASDLAALQAVVAQLEQEDHTPPPGVVIAVAGERVPEGYVKCDGTFYPKVGQYEELYSVIGDRYGASADDFRVPDYRGYFLRGWLHDSTNDSIAPDEANRTYSGRTTLNLETGLTGNRVGTRQGHASSQIHTFTTGIQSQNHNHNQESHGTAKDHYCASCATPGGGGGNTDENSSDHTHSGITNHSGVDNETRPNNITVMYVIRY